MPKHQHPQTRIERRSRERREDTDRREVVRFEYFMTPRRSYNGNRRAMDDIWTHRDRS